MRVQISHRAGQFNFDTTQVVDLSIPLVHGQQGPNCFYAPLFEATPLKSGDFIGDTLKGSPVNFYNVAINPHGNGTHTECVGHISTERVSIHEVLKETFFVARLVSIYPQRLDNNDRCITEELISPLLASLQGEDALIVRTMPNETDKKSRVYSGSNPPYFTASAIRAINEAGINHLMTDLPSVDREEDGGRLEGHKAFWNYPETLNKDRTISELVYVPNDVKDGTYVTSIQIPPFDLDAAPSRILLYLS
ncbi:MAG: cyclase family protein [Saprospiraceae bacterium]|nr:cyclase family protein [Saprospiraceae bacterium]